MARIGIGGIGTKLFGERNYFVLNGGRRRPGFFPHGDCK